MGLAIPGTTCAALHGTCMVERAHRRTLGVTGATRRFGRPSGWLSLLVYQILWWGISCEVNRDALVDKIKVKPTINNINVAAQMTWTSIRVISKCQ